MKKTYSISLEEDLMKILDDYCLKRGITRSEEISNWIVDTINNGVNPIVEKEHIIQERRVMLLRKIHGQFYGSSDVIEFIKKFDLDIRCDYDELCLSFESNNKKFYCEIKIINDYVKLIARLESSSKNTQKLFDDAYLKNEYILTEQGFIQNTYQRFWSLEYRRKLEEEFDECEIAINSKFIFKKFLFLYTNFLIELSFVADKKDVKKVIEQTSSLKNYEKESDHIKAPYLKIIVGAKAGKRYAIGDRNSLIIGRGNVNIDLTEQEHNEKKPVVSKRHAEISEEKNKFYIRDLNSTNGTLLNSTKTTPNAKHPLEDGDKILISDIEMIIKLCE